MKKQITATVATLSFIVVLTTIGFAGLGATLNAKVPFDFMVNGKTMPAGEYTLTPGAAPYTLIIRNVEKGDAAITIVRKGNDGMNQHANLTFRRYGNQSFLAATNDGWGGSQELPVSKAEQKAARGKDNLAMKDVTPEIITIGATIGQ
ncbi:MAG: hypothetical protein AB7P14_05555 [Blastocatellales bacterium]